MHIFIVLRVKLCSVMQIMHRTSDICRSYTVLVMYVEGMYGYVVVYVVYICLICSSFHQHITIISVDIT